MACNDGTGKCKKTDGVPNPEAVERPTISVWTMTIPDEEEREEREAADTLVSNFLDNQFNTVVTFGLDEITPEEFVYSFEHDDFEDSSENRGIVRYSRTNGEIAIDRFGVAELKQLARLFQMAEYDPHINQSVQDCLEANNISEDVDVALASVEKDALIFTVTGDERGYDYVVRYGFDGNTTFHDHI